MAYGTFPGKTQAYSVNQIAYFSGNTQALSWSGNFFKNGSGNVIRSGTNAVGPFGAGTSPNPRPLVQVVKTLYTGPKLAYKVYNPRVGRFVWARKPIQVYKLVKAPYKKGKPKRGLNLPPNELNFRGHAVEFFGLNQTVVSMQRDANFIYASVYATGDGLWADFGSWGGGTVGTSPQSFMGDYPDRWQQIASDLSTELIPILYKKVKNQDVNLLQALAEYKQSAEMFVSTLTRAGQALLALKRGRLRKAADILFPQSRKELANDFLLFQYGIKPLLSDIDGAAKMLANPEKRRFDIIVRRKRAIPRVKLTGSEGVDYSSAFYHKTEVFSEGEVEVVYKVTLEVSTPVANLDRELARLGFGNLSSVAYEVLPWSFIADWVIPVGDYLNNLDAFSALTVVSAHKTTFVKEVITWSRTFGGSQYGWTTYPSKPMGFQNTRRLCVRNVGIQIPDLPFPGFENPFSMGRFFNSLALFTQLRK